MLQLRIKEAIFELRVENRLHAPGRNLFGPQFRRLRTDVGLLGTRIRLLRSCLCLFGPYPGLLRPLLRPIGPLL